MSAVVCSCGLAHQLCAAEDGDGYPPAVMAVEMEAVEGGAHPKVQTRDPNQHCVLEALGQVRVRRVPCCVPVL